jgi:hypothetical protein
VLRIEAPRAQARRHVHEALDSMDSVAWYLDEGDRIVVSPESEYVYGAVELAAGPDPDSTMVAVRTQTRKLASSSDWAPKQIHKVERGFETGVVDALERRTAVEVCHEVARIDPRTLDADERIVGGSETTTSKAVDSDEAQRQYRTARRHRWVKTGLSLLAVLVFAYVMTLLV